MNKTLAIILTALIFAGVAAVAAFNMSVNANSPTTEKSCGGSCTETNSCGLDECNAATTGTCGCQKSQGSLCPCGCDGNCGGGCDIESCGCNN